MRYSAMLIGLVLGWTAGKAGANGLLVPSEAKMMPLAMVSHKVSVAIEDQVAVTTIEQTFRNHTDRNLEATYLFPIPRGASVNKFAMWIDGKETQGELLEAKQANQIYTDIVRRTQDPGLLEYLGNNLMRMKVFPIPPRGDQKVKVSYTSVAPMEQGVVEYLYPLRCEARTMRTLEEFAIQLTIRSQHAIQSVYSPTHAIDVKRKGDREVKVDFEKNQTLLDKDFQLFYGLSNQEIGLTPLTYRPVSSEDGYFMLMVTPQVEGAKAARVPRDLVLVLDTSGSMSDQKMAQAKKALKHLMGQLKNDDRFALVGFSSTVRHFEEKLLPASTDNLEKGTKWVDDLRAGGGTAILPALEAALDLRSKDQGRSFTIVFLTDGVPTLDERDPAKIVKNVVAKAEKSENARIFTFGVGDDVNAAMLDQLAESTRALSTYVRPSEDIEAKAASLQTRISHPVMTNVKLSATNIKIHEVYPPKMPDLFHGGQVMVIGRYSGQGAAAIKLTGQVGKEERELTYELSFPTRTNDGKEFVEQLWARRKVGYLLDQIRNQGESKEVVDEVISLAKKYGIATPYTSYLVVPDGPMPVVPQPGRRPPLTMNPSPAGGGPVPPGLAGRPGNGLGGPAGPASEPLPVTRFAREQADTKNSEAGGIAANRGKVQDRVLEEELRKIPADQRGAAYAQALDAAKKEAKALKDAESNFKGGRVRQNQEGTLGVDLAITSSNLRGQNRLSPTAYQQVNGRNCVDMGGVWIDDQFTKEMKTIVIKAQSEAYFAILEKQPKMKDVYRLGNHTVWVTPSGTALVIDTTEGAEKLSSEEIDRLFVAKK